MYVYGGHSYLPMQFLSGFYNHRTDGYGGSFENRARFWLELLTDVREAVGKDCAIANRIAVAALGPAGVELDESLRFIAAADDLVDLWDVNVGSISEWSKDSGASRFFREGYQLEWTGGLKEATRKPVVGVGRLTSPDLMADIVRRGVWDLIGAARPSIADPFLPKKIEEGRYDEIRECIGCNVCVLKAETMGHLGCTQNATAGEEYRRGWHPEHFSRAANADLDVLVVGAGPAGLECAITLGKRGMNRVHLVDSGNEVGGSFRWIPRLPGLGEWARVVNWRTIQLERLANVEVIRNVRLDAAGVLEYGAELVVVATGSTWARDGLNASTHEPIAGALEFPDRVLTPEQVMTEGRRPSGRRVVVYDAEGYFVGAGIAELLALEGFEVELVTCLEQVAPVCDWTLEGPLLRRHLHERGVALPEGRHDHPHRRTTADRLRRVRRADHIRGERHRGRDSAAVGRQRSITSSPRTRGCSRNGASSVSTGSGTASRQGSRPTPSSTGIGSAVRSTRRRRRHRCPTGGSDSRSRGRILR